MFVMIATQSRECKAHVDLDICAAIRCTHANDDVGSHCIGLATETWEKQIGRNFTSANEQIRSL